MLIPVLQYYTNWYLLPIPVLAYLDISIGYYHQSVWVIFCREAVAWRHLLQPLGWSHEMCFPLHILVMYFFNEKSLLFVSKMSSGSFFISWYWRKYLFFKVILTGFNMYAWVPSSGVVFKPIVQTSFASSTIKVCTEWFPHCETVQFGRIVWNIGRGWHRLL